MLDQMCMCSATVARNAVTTAMATTGSLHQSRIHNEKLVHTLLKGHSILSLEGSLSGDCDVEKNGKWSCIYAVGSQEYQMVCTRLDIASADVGMLDKFDRGLQTDVQVFVDFDYAMAAYMTLTGAWKKEIWLKGLLAESGYELSLVAGIAIGTLVKGSFRSEVLAQVEGAAYRLGPVVVWMVFPRLDPGSTVLVDPGKTLYQKEAGKKAGCSDGKGRRYEKGGIVAIVEGEAHGGLGLRGGLLGVQTQSHIGRIIISKLTYKLGGLLLLSPIGFRMEPQLGLYVRLGEMLGLGYPTSGIKSSGSRVLWLTRIDQEEVFVVWFFWKEHEGSILFGLPGSRQQKFLV
ncbi:hypothetical protein Tco_0982017 [Tanacetum coccineum]